jgi:DNA-binding CsgD family transcriptional regulator
MATDTVQLTKREREVMELVADGLKSKDIAEKLYLSKRTVDFHIAHVYGKLGVKNKVAAIRKLELFEIQQ